MEPYYDSKSQGSFLPQDFLGRMQDLLGEEYPRFISSLAQERTYGLRVNTLKIAVPDLRAMVPFSLDPIVWAQEGFYYQPYDEPGKHPYHDAGLYYIQEPAAMAVTPLLDPQPGELILDLAAAPGGKSTHIASRMQGQGLLLANEIDFGRAKILAQNVERLGIGNCIVCSARPERLAEQLGSIFDRVLLDAPCSGEGMFRKEPEAAKEWSLGHVLGCASRQQIILESAATLVRPGGRLVYSTCTFAPHENEGVIHSFLASHPEFTLQEPLHQPGFSPGRPDWVSPPDSDLAKTVRLWPHLTRGEGHFIAILRKADSSGPGINLPKKVNHPSSWEFRLIHDWWLQHLNLPLPTQIVKFNERLYQLPEGCPDLTGIQLLRPGLELGVLRTNRFEPAHALALSLTPKDVENSVILSATSPEVAAYLAGETLTHSGPTGWYLVAVDGYGLGWGKLVTTTLKNHYPKGLRRR